MEVIPIKEESIADELVSIEKMIPNPFIVTNEAGEIIFANRLALDVFGYPHQTLLSKHLTSIIHFELPKLSSGCDSVICMGQRQNMEEMELKISYRTITESLTNYWCISIHEYNPTLTEALIPSNESSEIETLNYELDNRLKELQVFSYAVAHDLQAPLRGIDGYTNLFIKKYYDQLDEHGKRLLTKVIENVNKMQLQLQQLNYLLKLGTTELHFVDIDMHALTMEVLQSLQLNKVIQVTIEKGTQIKGAVILIKDVLAKLISNAVKFSPEHQHSKIEIGCQRQGAKYHFFVKDIGIGFDEAYKESVFDIFQQLHDPEKYPGIGLSLATVKQIISRHGGHVWATGKEGEGATFYFSLHINTSADEKR